MTDALYLEDSTETTFEATVDRVAGDRVVLDRTQFYPTGGGQPHDTGVLGADGDEWAVTGVENTDTIYHEVDGDPPAAGTSVRGEVDADRRRAHSRYHTAQHLLSAVLLAEFDAPTTGNQVYADRARLDCEHDRFSESDLEALEAAVNELVDAGHDVTWYTLDRETAEAELDPERTRLDLLPDSITEVRIVDIDNGDVDRTACAGTHVENTSEVGEFEITGRETAGSGRERIRFVLD
ncbi:alanyl-tRNA editing protein [Halobacterium bonnevillei]|uniref:Alanyl-tRNA editing protein n=1 Tax=Halobacterium bonnevillei TaxID=2692200 RepID=A0A6B0SME0_9EURY|nr:alanyl-tRNA editing protein [Halobacterium bonnevillei]MXR21656.1 alanyl-tRNA editing protein [Halobacterium bonnevillei]